jgi:hypothetical protein
MVKHCCGIRSEERAVVVAAEVDMVIHRASDVVSEYAADPSNAPAWYAPIESVEWRTPPPMQLRSRLGFVAHFLGRRLTYTYEIVDFVPGR